MANLNTMDDLRRTTVAVLEAKRAEVRKNIHDLRVLAASLEETLAVEQAIAAAELAS